MFNSRRNEQRAQALLTRIANRHCNQVNWLYEGPRTEPRAPVTMGVWVVPYVGGQPHVDLAFACVTKELATRGIALAVAEPITFDEALVGMSCEGQMYWLHTQVRHVSPLGAGMWQVGLRICRLLESDECGALKNLVV